MIHVLAVYLSDLIQVLLRVATLKFEVLAAEGDADVEITVNQRSTYNVDLEEVVFAVMSGAVLISPPSATTTTATTTTTTTTTTTSTTKVTTTTAATTSTTTKATTTTTATTSTTTKTQTTTTTTGITTSLTQSTTTTTLETTAIPLNDALIKVDTVSGTIGDTIAVPIRIQHNPGIATLSLNVSYDSSKLKLLGVEDGKILGESTFLTTDSLKKIPYILSWDDLSTKNNTGNGLLAILNFEVIASEGASCRRRNLRVAKKNTS